jgi:copper homeostasis protein (lipoprotein)
MLQAAENLQRSMSFRCRTVFTRLRIVVFSEISIVPGWIYQQIPEKNPCCCDILDWIFGTGGLMEFSLRRFLACAILFALVFTAHSQTNKAEQEAQAAQFAAKAKTMHLLGVFQGTTPCADCSGIVTTLTLYTKAPNDFTDSIYKMNLKYIDRGSFTSYGSWDILRGRPGDPDATVYELNPDKSKGKQYYLRVDDNTLQQLDAEMKPIDSPLNFTLKRIGASQKAGMPNPASVNCTKRGGTLKIETGKDGGQVGICTFPNGKQCEEWALMRNQCSPNEK